MFTIGELVVWLIVGALSGSLAAMLVTRRREGLGRWRNVGVGLAGALLGGMVFELFGIDLGLGDIAVSFEDLVAAFLGSLAVLGIAWYVQRRRRR